MVFRQNLNRMLATGHNGLCPRILKECFSQLCNLFHNTIDLLIANSAFPTSLKITSDTPIQGGPCDNPNDYTPSLDPSSSLQHYQTPRWKASPCKLTRSHLIYKAQSGVRPNHFTGKKDVISSCWLIESLLIVAQEQPQQF